MIYYVNSRDVDRIVAKLVNFANEHSRFALGHDAPAAQVVVIREILRQNPHADVTITSTVTARIMLEKLGFSSVITEKLYREWRRWPREFVDRLSYIVQAAEKLADEAKAKRSQGKERKEAEKAIGKLHDAIRSRVIDIGALPPDLQDAVILYGHAEGEYESAENKRRNAKYASVPTSKRNLIALAKTAEQKANSIMNKVLSIYATTDKRELAKWLAAVKE